MSAALILGLVGGLLVVAFLANRVFRLDPHSGRPGIDDAGSIIGPHTRD